MWVLMASMMVCWSGGMAGGMVVIVPLTSMVAERRGRRALRTRRRDHPVRSWMVRVTASAANTMVRWASMASRLRAKNGRAAKSDFVILKDCSTCHRSW